MRQFSVLVFCLSIFFSHAWAQQNFTISGQIEDASSGEDLIGVTVLVKEIPNRGTISNDYGFYSLTLPAGEYTLVYRYIGYDAQEFPLSLTADLRQDIALAQGAVSLDEVVIASEAENEQVTSTEIGVSRLDIAEIDKIPVIFGEKDILKTIQLLPGVQTAGEGSSGFFVRGGSADQNLILLDEAPVYNASHLLGFFSVFNSDALKDVKLYKGPYPAEYGGRLSSVMDIRMKEGNSQGFHADGGLGLISSRLTLQGPIVEDKGSFMIAGRRTYADIFLPLFETDEVSFDGTALYFYDLNAKANYKLGENDRIFISGYFGRDVFQFSEDFGFDWGNTTGTLRWNHIFGSKLFSNTSIIYSDYDYQIEGGGGAFSLNSSIQDWNFKQDFDYYINGQNSLSFGANVIYHTFDPGEVGTSEENGIGGLDIENRYALESSIYLSNLQKVTDKLSLEYGIRYNNFTQLGPGTIYTFDTEGNITDTQEYGSQEPVVTYHGLAPRLTGSYVLNDRQSIKGGYARTYQYLHLLSNSTGGTPVDLWLPSSNNIAPEIADQVSLGYFQNFADNAYEFSIEAYYKDLQNVIDYKPGANVTLNPEVEGDLLYGDGRAYGVEFYVKKRKGRLTGWISYTLSRSERQFEEINRGEWFSALQDRRHDFTIVGMYQITDRITVSATWLYYTGNAVTFPTGQYVVDGTVYNYYGDRNANRMPDYHRLDVGLTIDGKKYKEVRDKESGELKTVPKRFQSSWNFSCYNAYGRQNAFSINFQPTEADPTQSEAVQLSLFRWVPSVTWNFSF